jgi:DNA repair exonuclease SbcCD ATPase subunit
LERLDINVGRLGSAIQYLQNSKVEVDFSVVLRAIQDSALNADFHSLRHAIDDTRRSLSLSNSDHKAEMGQHFEHVCKLIRDSCSGGVSSQPLSTSQSMPQLSVPHDGAFHDAETSVLREVRQFLGDHRAEVCSRLELCKPGPETLSLIQKLFSEQRDQISQLRQEVVHSRQTSANSDLASLSVALQQHGDQVREVQQLVRLDVKQQLDRLHEAVVQNRFGETGTPVMNAIQQLQRAVDDKSLNTAMHQKLESLHDAIRQSDGRPMHQDMQSRLEKLHEAVQQVNSGRFVSDMHQDIQTRFEKLQDAVQLEDMKERLENLHDAVQQVDKNGGLPNDMHQNIQRQLERLHDAVQQGRAGGTSDSSVLNAIQQLHQRVDDRSMHDSMHQDMRQRLEKLHDAVQQTRLQTPASTDASVLDAIQRLQHSVDDRPVHAAMPPDMAGRLDKLHDAVQQMHGSRSVPEIINQDIQTQLEKLHDLEGMKERLGKLHDAVQQVDKSGRLPNDMQQDIQRQFERLHDAVQQGRAGGTSDSSVLNAIQQLHQRVDDRSMHDSMHQDVKQQLEKLHDAVQRNRIDETGLAPVLNAIEQLQQGRQAPAVTDASLMDAVRNLQEAVEDRSFHSNMFQDIQGQFDKLHGVVKQVDGSSFHQDVRQQLDKLHGAMQRESVLDAIGRQNTDVARQFDSLHDDIDRIRKLLQANFGNQGDTVAVDLEQVGNQADRVVVDLERVDDNVVVDLVAPVVEDKVVIDLGESASKWQVDLDLDRNETESDTATPSQTSRGRDGSYQSEVNYGAPGSRESIQRLSMF